MRYTIHSDGGARGNPGPAGAGAIIHDEAGNVVATVSDYLGHQTNNFAEYEAVIRALTKLRELIAETERGRADVQVKMDSELIVKQVKGEYKVKHPVLQEKRAQLARLEKAFRSISFEHVFRTQNKEADLLANQAMDRGA